MTAIDGLRVFQQSAVDEVAAVLLDDVEQSEAELDFGDELEERQVEVTPEAYFQVEVEGTEPQGFVLAGCEIDHRVDAGNEVGTEVVVAWSCELHINGHGDVGALERLRTVGSAALLVIDGMFLSEVDCRQHTQREMIVQAKVAKHTHRETRAVVVNLGIPLLARLGVDVAVVLQLNVLHVEAKMEAIVETPLVDVGAVLHLGFLCKKA